MAATTLTSSLTRLEMTRHDFVLQNKMFPARSVCHVGAQTEQECSRIRTEGRSAA